MNPDELSALSWLVKQIRKRKENHKDQLAYGNIEGETVPYLRGGLRDLDWIEQEIVELRQRAIQELDVDDEEENEA